MQDIIAGFVAAVPRPMGPLVILVGGLIVVASVVRAAPRRVDAAAYDGRAIYYLISRSDRCERYRAKLLIIHHPKLPVSHLYFWAMSASTSGFLRWRRRA